MGLKLSNVIGAPFRNFVSEQLRRRVEKSTTDNRTIQEVLYLANKNAWVRLQSSVDTGNDYKNILNAHYTTREPDKLPYIPSAGSYAAKNWVLQSGTSIVNEKNEVTLRSGLGLEGAYGLGGITDQGYRPMPGLDSVTIETAGRLGSLRFATISFKVWNMSQLDIIDTLYFRLGFTMLLEWGHVEYYRNDLTFETNANGVDNFFSPTANKEQLLLDINRKIEESCGNYDGMLGTVSNFEYSMNQEGGWDCSIKLVGLGSLLETQKINSTYSMPESLAKNFKEVRARWEAQQNATNARIAAAAKGSATAAEAARVAKLLSDDQAAYDAAHKIVDRLTFYQSKYPTSPPAPPRPLNLQDANDVKALYTYTVVTPRTARDPARNFNEKSIVDGATNMVGYYPAPGDYVYPAWITKGPGGAQSGFKYPLKEGNTYKLDYNLVSKIIDNGIVNSSYASNYQTSPYKTSLMKLAMLQGNAAASTIDNFIDSFDTSGWSSGAAKNTVEYDKDITIQYGPAGAPVNVKQEVYNMKTSVSITGVIGTDWDNVKNTNYKYIDNSKVAQKIDTFIKNSNPANFVWRLVSKPVVGDYSSQADNGIAAKFATVVLDIAIPVDSVELRSSADFSINTNKYSTLVKLNFVVQITTEIPYIINELVSVAAGDLPPDPNDAKYKPGAVSTPPAVVIHESADDDGLSAMTSALEAMLTLVQYQAVVDNSSPGRVLAKPIDKITAQVLSNIPAAPMSQLFDAKGLLSSPPMPQKVNGVYPDSVYTDPYYLGLKGYNTSLMSRQINNGGNFIDQYEACPDVDFKNLMYSYKLPKTYSDSEESGGLTSALKPTYIKLGYLLFFINNICLIFDSTKPAPAGAAARPHFYIDFNPETNLCLTAPYQLAVNPQVCMLPWKGDQADYLSIFELNGAVTGSIGKSRKEKVFYFKDDPALKIKGEDIISNKLCEADTITKKSNCYRTDDAHAGKTMNILVNTQHLLNILRDSTNRDGHSDVYFKPFMDRLLEDLNKAMGDINAFRLGYIDSSNTAVVFDDQFVPPLPGEDNNMRSRMDLISPSGNAIIPIFGKNSIARTLDFQTNITTKMSSLIAIGARSTNDSKGSTQSTDGSSFHWLSLGLTDRIISEAEDIAKVKSNTTTTGSKSHTVTPKIQNNNQTLADNFNKYIRSIYGGSPEIDKAGATPMTNYYIQATTGRKGSDPATSGAPVIPLNLSFSTDGISGMNMGNVFMIPEDRLPISLRAGTDGMPRFGYMVMGLNHQLQTNQWVTNVRGQIIRLRTDESYAKALAVSSNQGPANVGTSPGVGGGGGGNVGGPVSNCDLFMYIAWQQGATGASQHYSLLMGNGKYTKYGISVGNIQGNWPRGYKSAKGVDASSMVALYNDPTKHGELAEAYVDVQRQLYANKRDRVAPNLNTTGTNRTGVPYATIKQAFDKYATTEVTANALANFASVENSLHTDTETSDTFQTMFQMNKTYPNFVAIISRLTATTSTFNSSYTEYSTIDELVKYVVPEIEDRWKEFKQKAGFTETC